MLKAMIKKELRELLPLALLGLAINFLIVLGAMGMPLVDDLIVPEETVPFDGGNLTIFIMFGCLFGILIGLWQNIREEFFGTFLFLLHRPMSRDKIFTIKLLVGSFVSFVVTFLPMFFYALWAATPGTHASPFYWSMTTWAFLGTLVTPVTYAGAFIASLRPGLWWGSRLLTAFGGIVAAMVIASIVEIRLISLLPVIPLVIAILYVSILHVVRSRDYA